MKTQGTSNEQHNVGFYRELRKQYQYIVLFGWKQQQQNKTKKTKQKTPK